MNDVHSFEAVMESHNSGGAFCLPPLDVPALFGTRALVRVRGTIDGYPFSSSLSPMGGHHILLIHKATRAAIGKHPGDTVTISLSRDTAERVVDVPEELAAALNAVPEARAIFDKLAYTHRKEYAQWIAEAKKPETRSRRIAKAVEMLLAGLKRS
ncbi:YdeI/OmpD-associated family protein [Hymenobacter sp. BT175]|uniref:YdeI/OmpD-associated family protein n=1 Tax=Hymenobacter translucens TaxID=2886507 RepID=UPI001D0E7A4C|nr:YdeI/OmpD-associated family protein [Hymenobacter translucens]MCC2547152.1 YdeI/OmpD-associated family protein [Hymenobacter translucens]